MRTLRLALLALAMLSGPGAATADTWLLIDTAASQLVVYQDGAAVERFPNIAIGSGGTSKLRMQGETTTPVGEFHINRINHHSRFHIFFGLDYPTVGYADRALAAGLIDQTTYAEFLDSLSRYGRPPQNTPLGGHIGIHGIGEGDLKVHRFFNWTNGCIALTNEQIEKLTPFVTVGTRVFIR